MQVLHVSHGWEEGGSQLYAARLAEAQAALGHQVRRFGPDAREARPRGFEGGHAGPATERRFAAELAGVDVVHVHHLSGLSLQLPRIAHEAGALVVCTLHDYWLACARGQLLNEAGNRCEGPSTARCAGCLAPELLAPIPAPVARRLPPRLGPVRRREEAWRIARAHTHAFFAPSAHVARRLGLEAIPTPLPLLQRIPPAPKPVPGVLRFLFLGSLIPSKGAHLLLEAYASLPAGSATLRIAGPSPAWRGSRRWAETFVSKAAATPGVSVAGGVSPAAVVAELHEADVLVLPSVWEENAPLVLGEATAAGLRIVASDIGGVSEVAPSAVLVEAGSVPALRAALIAEVRCGRQRMAPQTRPDLATHAGELLALYAKLRAARVGRG